MKYDNPESFDKNKMMQFKQNIEFLVFWACSGELIPEFLVNKYEEEKQE